MHSNETKRLFFALWPDESVRQALHALGEHYPAIQQARPTPVENIHLTLVFLGKTSVSRLPCLEWAAKQLVANQFTLCLDQVGYWARPQIFWVGAKTPPEPLKKLVRELQQNLSDCLTNIDRRPFRAHLTLARKCRRSPLHPKFEPSLAWRVEEFVLAESTLTPAGSFYRVLQRWPLMPPSASPALKLY